MIQADKEVTMQDNTINAHGWTENPCVIAVSNTGVRFVE